MDFSGVKAALYYRGQLLVYLRDNKPGLRFAGMWDFFGGGRENDENPFETLRRELIEELGFTITETQIIFQKIFPAMHDPSLEAYFMVVELTDENYRTLQFGSEGQEYKLMEVRDFMSDDAVVPLLKPRLQSFLTNTAENLLQSNR